MGKHAGYWSLTVRGLKHGPHWVLTRASLSCRDDTGFLRWKDAKLAYECDMTVRTIETHLPLLDKLELLKRADVGFRVVGWLRCLEKSSEKFSEERRKEPKEERRIHADRSGNLDLTSSLFQPSDDDAVAIQKIQQQTGTAPEIAEGAFYLGIHRHYGSSSRSAPIRSVSFFVPIVKELERDANFLGAGPLYRQYLRYKAKEIMKAGLV